MQRAVIVAQAGAPVELVDDLELDEPRAGEALVALEAAGVCGTDLALLTGKMPYPVPMVLGHEAAGRIVALGPATEGPPAGTRVTLWMRPPCRTCRACLRGNAGLCERSGAMSARGTLLDGRTGLHRSGEPVYRAFGIAAFTTAVTFPVSGLVPVPDDVPIEVAALLGCGVATGAGAMLNVAKPAPGDTVVVFGAGGVGLSAALAAAAMGAGAVVVVDPSEERRGFAAELGVATTAPGEGLRDEIRSLLGGEPVDIAVDAVGNPDVLLGAWKLVRQGGTAVAVGVQAADAVVGLPGAPLALMHKRLLGCFMGGIDPQRDLPTLFAWYRRGVLPVDRLIGARRPLEEAGAALDDLASARGLRTVLVP
ncbi:MAG: zinc-binding dehydrogenase [Phycisphaerales bacterium]